MQVEVDVKCMHTNFGGHDLFGFRDLATFKIWPNFPFISLSLSLSPSLPPSSSPSLELLKKLMLYYWLVLDSIGYYTLEDLQDLILMLKLFRFVHVHHVTNNRTLLLIELLLIIESIRLILVLKR